MTLRSLFLAAAVALSPLAALADVAHNTGTLNVYLVDASNNPLSSSPVAVSVAQVTNGGFTGMVVDSTVTSASLIGSANPTWTLPYATYRVGVQTLENVSGQTIKYFVANPDTTGSTPPSGATFTTYNNLYPIAVNLSDNEQGPAAVWIQVTAGTTPSDTSQALTCNVLGAYRGYAATLQDVVFTEQPYTYAHTAGGAGFAISYVNDGVLNAETVTATNPTSLNGQAGTAGSLVVHIATGSSANNVIAAVLKSPAALNLAYPSLAAGSAGGHAQVAGSTTFSSGNQVALDAFVGMAPSVNASGVLDRIQMTTAADSTVAVNVGLNRNFGGVVTSLQVAPTTPTGVTPVELMDNKAATGAAMQAAFVADVGPAVTVFPAPSPSTLYAANQAGGDRIQQWGYYVPYALSVPTTSTSGGFTLPSGAVWHPVWSDQLAGFPTSPCYANDVQLQLLGDGKAVLPAYLVGTGTQQALKLSDQFSLRTAASQTYNLFVGLQSYYFAGAATVKAGLDPRTPANRLLTLYLHLSGDPSTTWHVVDPWNMMTDQTGQRALAPSVYRFYQRDESDNVYQATTQPLDMAVLGWQVATGSSPAYAPVYVGFQNLSSGSGTADDATFLGMLRISQLPWCADATDAACYEFIWYSQFVNSPVESKTGASISGTTLSVPEAAFSYIVGQTIGGSLGDIIPLTTVASRIGCGGGVCTYGISGAAQTAGPETITASGVTLSAATRLYGQNLMLGTAAQLDALGYTGLSAVAP